nr:MAG TPA: hypothetical protein [Caudoviricetes sp.]
MLVVKHNTTIFSCTDVFYASCTKKISFFLHIANMKNVIKLLTSNTIYGILKSRSRTEENLNGK